MNPAETLAVTEEIRGSIRIMVVDDEPTLRESCASVLAMEGYAVSAYGTGSEALAQLKKRPVDVALIDLHMSQASGLDLLATCLAHNPEALVVIMTGDPSVESSLEALRLGAWDYLPKPFTASHLQILVGRAAHTVLVSRESNALADAREGRHGVGDRLSLLGRSPEFERVVMLAKKVAATDASVFLTGESGTGKEQVAQYIHQHSRRHSRQLVAVNCAALPGELLESEMFGHVQGAFTGAVREKPGLLEAANGGTLLLDEITEMPEVLQAKLLRVIQDGIVRRLGSTGTDAVVNVRFIAASNRDPQQAAAEGRLRLDLYYRLCVVPIHIPPLRERIDDIRLLAEHFLRRYWKQHRGMDGLPPPFSEEAIEELRTRSWPGNVRELQNVIEHAVVLLDPAREIRTSDLPHMVQPGAGGSGRRFGGFQPDFGDGSYHGARERMLSEFERSYLTRLIERTRGNMSRAARLAGVDRTTLYRLMEKHGLQRDHVIVSR